MRFPIKALRAGVGYFTKRPGEIFFAARNAMGLRSVVPLDALRWTVENLTNGRGPRDVVIGAVPPALSIAATLRLMGTDVRAGASIRVEEIRVSPSEFRLAIRLSEVTMVALQDNDTPLVALLKSGALDLSKPGNLANFMPGRPPVLIEAKDDRVVVDLMKNPRLAANPMLKKLLGVVTPVVSIGDLRTERDHIVVAWRTRFGGLPTALAALRAPAGR